MSAELEANQEIAAFPKKLEWYIKENSVKGDGNLIKAYIFARNAHKGVFREGGEPYFIHCLRSARIAYEELHITDVDTLTATFLHDVPEDTNITLDEIEKEFNQTVRFLVDGVSKFKSDNPETTKDQINFETYKKVFVNTDIDPRVAVIKCATDRVDNMRTLQAVLERKRKPKANETLHVYAKLAESLGLWTTMKELEDLSYKFLYPEKYEKFFNLRREDPRTDPKFIAYLTSVLQVIAQESNINIDISTHLNSLIRIEKKMVDKPIDKVNDLISFRVVVKADDEVAARHDVYKMFGDIRDFFGIKEDQKRVDDFYSVPRVNGYSAIQLTVDFEGRGSVEIAITSEEKEEFNNYGVVSLMRKGVKNLKDYSRILVFTPTNDVKFFPSMTTGVDFAYSIDPKMGASAEYMKVDGVEKLISTVLTNGSKVEIELPEKSRNTPNADILSYATLPETKRMIETQRDKQKEAKNIEAGRKIVYNIVSKQGIIDLRDIIKMKEYRSRLEKVLYNFGCNSLSELYRKVGSDIISPDNLEKIITEVGLTKEKTGITSILVRTLDEPGIFADLTSAITKMHGNIGPIDGRSIDNSKGSYSIRLVVKNLTKEDELKLTNALGGDSRFKKVVIV